jgi:hypothetical protein
MDDISELVRELEGADQGRQAAAAEALARLGSQAQGAAVALVRQVGHRDETVSGWCNAALEELGPPSPAQLADLTALASAADANIAYWAVTLLGRAGEQAAPALPVLRERSTDAATPHVQRRAKWAIERISAG